MNSRANPRLGFRWCGVPIALASTVAIALVATLSFGSYGVATALGKVRPLRDAYRFLSGAYDRLVERLRGKFFETPETPPRCD